MTGTIFDLVEGDLPEGKEGFMELAKRAPQPKEKSFLNDIKEYGKTALKGTAEGLIKLGQAVSPLQEYRGIKPQEAQEQFTEKLEEFLPTEDEGFGQRALRRGLQEAPTAMAASGKYALQTLPRALLAGFFGEGAKELGAPEWAQTAAELTAYLGPGGTKKLLETGKNENLIREARKFGLSDEQITPLIQSDFKQKWLSKLSPKRGKTQEALKSTKDVLSNAYQSIQSSPIATQQLGPVDSIDLLKKLSNIASNMPAGVRNTIKQDAKDLLKNPLSGESLINFFSDINHYLGANTKQLSLFKKPIKEALYKISPELGKDFEMINELHSKYYSIASKLKPTITSDIISAAETLGVLGGTFGAVFGHYPMLVSIMGEQLAKKVAQQMLINPRFQQLGKKMAVALNQNKYNLAKKINDQVRDELSKISPEAADKIEDFSKEDFEEMLKGHSHRSEE